LRAEANIPGSESSRLTVGQVVGERYRLVRMLDGKARIWRATDESDRSVVLKTGAEILIDREFQVLSALSHPHIVATMGRVDCGAGCFIVLEHLAGGDLVSLAGLSPRYWLQPVADVIAALGYLHRHSVVHRDLKARNVLIDIGNRARLIDFESALAIGSRWTAGGTTEILIRPERGNQPVSVADDDYALACLLHEMLYGMPPGTNDRKPAPGFAEPLVRLVDASLEAPGAPERPGLDRFAAVVELLNERLPEIQ
jgi:serine/threonine-protein kinase